MAPVSVRVMQMSAKPISRSELSRRYSLIASGAAPTASNKSRLTGVVAGLAFLLLGSLPLYAEGNRFQDQLRQRLEQLGSTSGRNVNGVAVAAHAFLPKLYAALDYEPAWRDPKARAALQSAVARSWEDGLQPSDFHQDIVDAAVSRAGPTEWDVSRDLVLSDAFVRLLYQLYFGKVRPNSLDGNWNYSRPAIADDTASKIAGALRSGAIEELVEEAKLKHPFYQGLKSSLQAFTDQAANGGWPKVPEGPVLKPGDVDARIDDLRKRLTLTGELEVRAAGNGELYDDALVQAVRKFQENNDLSSDGVVGPATLAALNVTVGARIDQIRVNLERARWVLRDIGSEMVVVNIAGQYLHLFLKGKRVWSSRVIVGKTYTKTPVFTETMKSIVLNPDWGVPRSIIRNEIFPKAVRDPGYLSRNDYQLRDGTGRAIDPMAVEWSKWTPSTFPYRVVQQPGPKNALGLVKFLFPNKHAVYLHDTPNRQLFSQTGRTFSHGCIRVQDPLKLAELILQDRLGWDRSKIDSIVSTAKLRNISLPEPLPVLLLYWTVDPSFDGGAHFHKDIYGRDAALLKALDKKFDGGS